MKAEVYITVSGDTQITIITVSLSEMVSGLCERTAMLHTCKRVWPSLVLLLSHDISHMYDHMNHAYCSCEHHISTTSNSLCVDSCFDTDNRAALESEK